MEGKKEKNTSLTAYPMQQKVFKFHNVSKDVILGNKKPKKAVKRNTRKVPPDKIQSHIEESQEKMAQLILKQYIPIRQKCLPVVNSQTKKHMETLSMRKAKKSLTFGSKSFLLGQNKNNKLEQPTKDTSQDLEKPPGIRLVDISLLKDPKSSCDNSLDNVHEPERTENENLSISPKCNPVESVDIHNYAWTSSPVFINHNDEAPLDLSKKKQPPEPPPTEEIFQLFWCS